VFRLKKFDLQMTWKNAFKVKFKATNFFPPKLYNFLLLCFFLGESFSSSTWKD